MLDVKHAMKRALGSRVGWFGFGDIEGENCVLFHLHRTSSDMHRKKRFRSERVLDKFPADKWRHNKE